MAPTSRKTLSRKFGETSMDSRGYPSVILRRIKPLALGSGSTLGRMGISMLTYADKPATQYPKAVHNGPAHEFLTASQSDFISHQQETRRNVKPSLLVKNRSSNFHQLPAHGRKQTPLPWSTRLPGGCSRSSNISRPRTKFQHQVQGPHAPQQSPSCLAARQMSTPA